MKPELITVGRVTGVFGIQGWVKVVSYTDPPENLFAYTGWQLNTRHGARQVQFDVHQAKGRGFIVHIDGVDDRDLAAGLVPANIAIAKTQLPALKGDDYYWHQLEGCEVVADFGGRTQVLGKVAAMLETGANDVMRVEPDSTSCDDRERLIPFVLDQYVTHVDLEQQQITVAWDPEF